LTVGSRAPDVRGLDQVLARVAAWIWFPSRDAYCRSRQATLFWQVWNKAVADHVGDDLVSAAGSSLLDLAAHSDIVVVAAKLSSDARETDLGLVLRAVQPTAYFVTIARAAIVDYRVRCVPRLRIVGIVGRTGAESGLPSLPVRTRGGTL
jgi:hypothetical protein